MGMSKATLSDSLVASTFIATVTYRLTKRHWKSRLHSRFILALGYVLLLRICRIFCVSFWLSFVVLHSVFQLVVS